MRRLALSDPLLVAGGIISAVSSSTVGHAEKQAFSDYQPVCPRQCQRYPHDVTPTPEGGEGAPPSVSRETMGISSPSRRCPALRAIAVNDAYAHNDVLSTSDPNATALQVLPRCTETVSGYECKRPTPVLNGLATTLTSAHSYSLIRPTPYNAFRDRWGSVPSSMRSSVTASEARRPTSATPHYGRTAQFPRRRDNHFPCFT